MKSSLTFLAVFVVVLAAHAAAIAGPGDPRLVNGVLEWPRALTNEPFVVVRGDDGALYYVTLTAARRDATLAGGSRIAVLGLEGRTPHEITALGVGVGDSVESALANLQGAKPAPAASAPAVVTPPTAAAPTPPIMAAPTIPNGAAPTAAAPAPPPNGGAAAIAPGVKAPSASTQVGVVPPTRAPAAATNIPAAPTAVAPAPTTTAPAPTITGPAPTTTAPAPNAAAPAPTAPAPAVTPTTPGFGPYPAVISAPTAPPAVSTAAAPPKQPVPEVAPASAPMPSLARDDRRWTEVTGVVEAINGRTLVLRSTEGRVAVDMSNLSSNFERILTPGATVRVYGLPVEVRFKAMGFVSP
jgi:hypothetical protein